MTSWNWPALTVLLWNIKIFPACKHRTGPWWSRTKAGLLHNHACTRQNVNIVQTTELIEHISVLDNTSNCCSFTNTSFSLTLLFLLLDKIYAENYPYLLTASNPEQGPLNPPPNTEHKSKSHNKTCLKSYCASPCFSTWSTGMLCFWWSLPRECWQRCKHFNVF